MGVMLSLDRPTLARSRRQARHARRPDDQAWADALAAIFRDEAPSAGSCLARLAKTVLAGWLQPAGAWARRADGTPPGDEGEGGPEGQPPASRAPRTASDLSVPCLLGQCQDSPGAPACASVTCAHDCHGRAQVPRATGAPAA
jgi:hypothetical protein